MISPSYLNSLEAPAGIFSFCRTLRHGVRSPKFAAYFGPTLVCYARAAIGQAASKRGELAPVCEPAAAIKAAG
jgi:hypothetical protein